MQFFFKDISASLKNAGDGDKIHRHEADLLATFDEIANKRSEATCQRLKIQNKWTSQKRVETLCDANADIWYLDELQSYKDDSGRTAVRLGVICALCTVQKRQCIVIANDNTVGAGCWWPQTAQKIQRAQKMALQLHIPVLYLIECSGLYLPTQHLTYAASDGAGAIFENQAALNRAGVVQLAAVFGDCIAGGGYLPLMCNKIAMTENASICIGGSALNVNAHAGIDAKLGTANIHVHHSGCADFRFKSDQHAIEWLQAQVALLPQPMHEFYQIDAPMDSPVKSEDLYQLLPVNGAMPFDMEYLIACLADGAQAQEICPSFGREIISMLMLVLGLPVICIANNPNATYDDAGTLRSGGLLYRDGIEKIRAVVRAAQDDGIPIMWILDVAGFEIGPDAEYDGLLKHGAMLLYEIANHDRHLPPNLTLILRKASGAGYYAMKGAPFHPAWTVGTSLTKLEVMSPDILASTMFHKKLSKLPPDDPTRSQLETARNTLAALQKKQSDVRAALSRGDIDSWTPLSKLRALTETFVRAAWQNPAFPTKPQRLWSILQLDTMVSHF